MGFIQKLVFLSVLSLFISCDKTDDLVGIEMPYRYQFDVPAGLNPLNTHFFERKGLLTNFEQLSDENDIRRIIPFQARLVSLDNIDFGFVREIEVRVKDPENPSLEIPVFYREELPTNTGQTIDLIATQADVTTILQVPTIDVVVEMRLYGTTGQTFRADMQLTFLAQ